MSGTVSGVSDLLAFRERFPILEKMTYLASHSLGAVPAAAEDELRRYYREWAELGIAAWDGPWWEAVVDFSADIERVLGAGAGSVPMLNVTRAMAAVVSCFEWTGERKRVVTTGREFSTTRPLLSKLERLGAEVVIVDSDDGGVTVDPAKVAAAVDERTRGVCSRWFRSGGIRICGRRERAKDGGGYQAAGCVRGGCAIADVDFYVGGCTWLCGGPGAGFLYVRPELVGQLEPRLTGWFGLKDPFSYDPGAGGLELNGGVHRFLAGTPNVPGLYAARAGVRTVLEVGVENIRERSVVMTSRIAAEAVEAGFRVRSPMDAAKRSGMVCLQFEGSEAATAALIERGVMVDWRPDCGLRVSPHFYTTDEEIDRFFVELRAARGAV